VIVNGDILSDVDLTLLWEERAPAVMALRRQAQPIHTGVSLELDTTDAISGTVRGVAKVVGEGDPGLHFTGIHVLDRSVLDLVPPGESCIIRTAYKALIPEGKVRGRLHPGEWTDIGTIAEYEAANAV
jgi:NDP-sugar pyrophosphorylase family protein